MDRPARQRVADYPTKSSNHLVIFGSNFDDVAFAFDGVDAESRLLEEQEMAQVILGFVFRVENAPRVRRRRAAQLGTPKVVLHL